jgi:hypothetical protein
LAVLILFWAKTGSLLSNPAAPTDKAASSFIELAVFYFKALSKRACVKSFKIRGWGDEGNPRLWLSLPYFGLKQDHS